MYVCTLDWLPREKSREKIEETRETLSRPSEFQHACENANKLNEKSTLQIANAEG